MTVIWRENLNIKGKTYLDRKVYKSASLIITKEDESKADELDKLIQKKVKEIQYKAIKKGLMKLKKKKGVLELWYLVGKILQFIDNDQLLKSEDRQFVWEAIWYHFEKIAPKLIPGNQKKRRGTYRDHFLQCYKLGKLSWDVVKNSGNWSDWMEFFDSTTNEDKRIFDWIQKKVKKENLKDYWLKRFYRLLKQKFSRKVTEVFSDKELHEELELLWLKHKNNR